MDWSYNETKLLLNNPLEIIDYIKILHEQGKSNFNPIEYWKETQKEEIYQEYLNGLSKKDRKKLRSGSKVKEIRSEVTAKQNLKKEDHDEFILNKVSQQDNINNNNIKDFLSLKTESGRIKLLIELLKLAIDNSNIEMIKHLYLTLLNTNSSEYQKQISNLLNKVNRVFNLNDKWFQIQMEELYSYLPPLDLFSHKEKKLDQWQIDIFKMIDRKENVIIVAKTSSGKTVCSTYVVFKNNKVLYVLPTAELARQVAGILRNTLNGNVMLITNKEKFIESDSYKVVVGTPYALENFIIANYKSLNFDYVVYDEIHQVNEDEGDSLQRIIQLLDCNFLALSATVENPEDLKNWWSEIKQKPVNLVIHDTRFIVQQRYIWNNNKLEILHPMSAVNLDYIKSNGLINGTMSFTPKDSYDLYLKLKNKKYDLSPENFFGNKKRITLEDSKEYEKYLKLEIKKIADTNPNAIQEIIQQYNIKEIESKFNLYKLLRQLYESDRTPLICYKLDEGKIMELFTSLVEELETLENEEYPYYRQDIEMQHEYYKKYQEKLQTRLQNLKIPKGEDIVKYKENITREINNEFLDNMNLKFYEIFSERKNKLNESDIDMKLKLHHVKYCDKLLLELNSKKSLTDVNPYQPHPKYTFNTNITDDIMRTIKKRLCRESKSLIDYSHIYMRGLERGVIIYSNNLPLHFQRMGQSLLNEKKVSVIFSDKTLAYGLNLPIRTVIIIGQDIDPLVAQQMSGRAGRRGIDNQGHVVYVDTNWKNIMMGSLPKIEGKNPFNLSCILPLQFLKMEESIVRKQFQLSLREYIYNEEHHNIYIKYKEDLTTLGFLLDDKEIANQIVWKLRDVGDNNILISIYLDYMLETYKNVKQHNIFDVSKQFMKEIIAIFDMESKTPNIEINSKLVSIAKILNNKYNYNIQLLNKDDTLLNYYIENRILDNVVNVVNRFNIINRNISIIHNYILESKYDYLKKIFEFVFERIKKLVGKY